MGDARVTLPPLVEGPARGRLLVSLGAPRWSEAAPAHFQQLQQRAGLAARIAWWGDASGGDLLPLPPGSGCGGTPAAAAQAHLAFQLRTGPRYLTRYLKDAGALDVYIQAARNNSTGPCASPTSSSSSSDAEAAAPSADAPLAVATVGLLALDVQAPISGTYPLVLADAAEADSAAASSSSGGTIIGSLPVRLELDYSPAVGGAAMVTSFELNEHLASRAEAGTAAVGSVEDGAAAAEALPALCVCSDLVAAVQDRWVCLHVRRRCCCPAAGHECTCAHMFATRVCRELMDAAAQQLALDTEEEADSAALQQHDVRQRLLPLLLPCASEQQLDHAAAMLHPFGGAADSTQQPGVFTLEQLAAVATECAAVERRVQPPVAKALRGLRELAVALGSRSLDLAAAFAAAEGQRLPVGELVRACRGLLLQCFSAALVLCMKRLCAPIPQPQGALLRRLYPAASEGDARHLLALMAAQGGSDSPAAVTLPAIKVALGQVLEAQQFPVSPRPMHA